MHFPSDLFIKMPFGNCRKWHLLDPTFQNFLKGGNMPTSLERLRRSIHSSCVYILRVFRSVIIDIVHAQPFFISLVFRRKNERLPKPKSEMIKQNIWPKKKQKILRRLMWPITVAFIKWANHKAKQIREAGEKLGKTILLHCQPMPPAAKGSCSTRETWT